MSALKKTNILNTKDLTTYFLVAGTGALVQLFVSSLVQGWFGLSFKASINVAYPVSLLVGFILTKLFAFNVRNTNQTPREVVKFMIVALVSWGVTWTVAVGSLAFSRDVLGIPAYRLHMVFVRKAVNVNEMVCYIIGQGFSFMVNFVLHKTFTFKSTGFYNRLKVLLKD